MTIIRPPGLVSMLDRSLPVLFNQADRDARKEFGHTMKDLYQCPQIHTYLFTDSPHGHPMQIVHRCRCNDQLIPKEGFRQHPRRMRLKGSATTRTVLFGHDIERLLRFKRGHINHRASFGTSMLQGTAALRTSITYLGLQLNDMVCFRFIKALTTMTGMAFLRPPLLTVILRRGVRLEGNFGGRR